MTPWLNAADALAPPLAPPGLAARIFCACAPASVACVVLLLHVVHVGEAHIGFGRVRIDLDRLLVRDFGLVVVLLPRVHLADVGVALDALGHLDDDLVELRDGLVELAFAAERDALVERPLDRGPFGFRFLGVCRRRGATAATARPQREVQFLFVDADLDVLALCEISLARGDVVLTGREELRVLTPPVGLGAELPVHLLADHQDGRALNWLVLGVDHLALEAAGLRVADCRESAQAQDEHA